MLTTVDKGDAVTALAPEGNETVAAPGWPTALRPSEPQSAPTITLAPRRTRPWWILALLVMLINPIAIRSSVQMFDMTAGQKAGPPAPLPYMLPYGKGMWIWQPDQSDGGNVQAIVDRAKDVGLTHIYVRTGSSSDGFYAAPFLDALLPVAHAAGIRIYGWDFPTLANPSDDATRSAAEIGYETPTHQHIDGLAADIETPSEGTHISADAVTAYATQLRSGLAVGYPLIATVPRPSDWTETFYPYATMAQEFDAIAPMVYWLNRQPDTDVTGAVSDLAVYGKPIFPVGQAFDGGPEGGRPGLPTPDELNRFMQAAASAGAQGVSFWSWQAADQTVWDTIEAAPQFKHIPANPLPRQPVVLQAG